MRPRSDSAGSDVDSIATVPMAEREGHVMFSVTPRPNCAGVQPCRPFAADGFIVSPGGRLTTDSLRLELSIPAGFVFCGTVTSVVTPSGSSDLAVSGVRLKAGSN